MQLHIKKSDGKESILIIEYSDELADQLGTIVFDGLDLSPNKWYCTVGDDEDNREEIQRAEVGLKIWWAFANNRKVYVDAKYYTVKGWFQNPVRMTDALLKGMRRELRVGTVKCTLYTDYLAITF